MFAVNYKIHSPLGHSEPLRQFQLGDSASRIKGANLDNSVDVKFGVPLSFSMHCSVSTFLLSIVIVVGARTEPKMIRPNTRRIVASVQNAKTRRNWAKMENPACYMGKEHLLSISADEKPSVPLRSFITCPQPASISDLHLAPKAFNKSWRKTLSREEVNPIVSPLDQFHTFLVGSRSGRSNAPGQLFVKGYHGCFSV